MAKKKTPPPSPEPVPGPTPSPGPAPAPTVSGALIISPASFAGEKAMRTAKAIAAEPKVRTFFQLIPGDLTSFECNINGVKFNVPKGKDVEIPQSVYQLIRNKMQAEGQMAAVSAAHVEHLNQMGK